MPTTEEAAVADTGSSVLNYLIPGAAAVLPGVIDLITGASRKREQALNQQDAALAGMINETQGQIGQDVTSSARFKSLMAALDRAYGKQGRAASQEAVASGASDEAKLGVLAKMNEGYNAGTTAAVGDAEQERARLRQHRDNLIMQRYGLGIGRATGDLNAQNQFSSGLAAVLPYIISGAVAPDQTKKIDLNTNRPIAAAQSPRQPNP